MRIFKTKVFSRFARKAGLGDAVLREAIASAERGLIDADLGGGVIKQRIARPGAGKSGGFRTIVLFRAAERAVFVYGFGKNERDNVREDELTEFRRLATLVLAYSNDEIMTALKSGALIEVSDGQAVP
jgi:hypothetical protein